MHPAPPRPIIGSHASEAGFTLIAIAAILLVLSAAVVLLLPNEASESRKRLRTTQVRLRMIELAIQNYSKYDVGHRILPCPARYDRSYTATAFQKPVLDCWKAAIPGNCDPTTKSYQGVFCNAGSTVVAGAVPVMALNLPQDAMLDGWGNKIVYVMDTQLANTTAGVSPTVLPTAYGSPFQIYSVGSTTPNDLRGWPLLNAGVQRPVGLLISAGPNQNGAISSYGTMQSCVANGYDSTNCDFDSDLQRYTADNWHNEDGVFDDVVVPILVEKRNCQPPVRCGYEPSGATTVMKNQPENCVQRIKFTGTNPLPLAAGGIRHGDTRAKGTSGTTLICCDGDWKDGSTCP